MPQKEMIILTNASLITCVVQKGLADEVVKSAQEAGAQGATIYYGRGTGVRERLGILGLTIEAEKEVITIMVANDQIDRIFEKMYVAGRMDTPGMGFMYVSQLEKAATYVPEEMIEKLVD
ncbi:MAG: P-II family nitrogen regulator [Methylococcales bacterium]|jgi:nitrogen regulatory protein P-II 1|nr:P-II family nitrogen regulator [Methylococcales bacterium]MBT7410321.1 P-II family nitrogen regulator [Methylococcales bacterium]